MNKFKLKRWWRKLSWGVALTQGIMIGIYIMLGLEVRQSIKILLCLMFALGFIQLTERLDARKRREKIRRVISSIFSWILSWTWAVAQGIALGLFLGQLYKIFPITGFTLVGFAMLSLLSICSISVLAVGQGVSEILSANKRLPDKLISFLPKDYRAYLQEYRERWIKRNYSPRKIEWLTYKHLFHSYWGLLQSKFENLRLPKHDTGKETE